MTGNLTWQEAAKRILEKEARPLHFTEIADLILERGLKTTVGATPAATVGAQLYTLAKKPDSPVEQVGKGVFRLRPQAGGPAGSDRKSMPDDSSAGADEPLLGDGGLLRAFGMFWQRDQVIWDGRGRLLGQQRAEAKPVDFAGQVGVYLLHDRDRVVYVGRASDSLFSRLRAHTANRLSGRWDRFSWFGLKGVDPESGALADPAEACSPRVVLETLEALLIESLEPPLNRRRGDGLDAIEYVQVKDPEIEKRRQKDLLDMIRTRAGL